MWCLAVWPTTLSLSAVDGKRTITLLIYIYILFVERDGWMDGWIYGRVYIYTYTRGGMNYMKLNYDIFDMFNQSHPRSY